MKNGLTVVSFMKSDKVQKVIEEKIGANKGEFTSNLLLVSQNSKLVSECEPKQLLGVALQSTLLGLSLNPNLGESYIVPFKSKGQAKAQLIIGYKGVIQLAIRTGQYKKIIATEVREGELSFNKFNESIEFKDPNPEGEIIGYFAKFELLNGFEKAIYWSIDEIKDHADTYSTAYNRAIGDKLERGEHVQDAWKYQSPWYKDFDAMAKKTLLLNILKQFGPKSVEMKKIDDVEKTSSGRESDAETVEQEMIEIETPKPIDEVEEVEEKVETEKPVDEAPNFDDLNF